MKKTILIMFFMVILVTSACRQTKYVPVERTVTETIRSVDTLVEYRLEVRTDSIVTDDTVSFLHNDYCYSWAVWSKGRLHHSLVVWPKTVLIEVPKTIIEKQVSEPKIVEVERKQSFWEKLELMLLKLYFITTLTAIGVYVAYRLIRKYRGG